MKLDLNDPQSIVAWHKVRPAVHGPQLETLAALWPQFRRTIALAQVIIQCESEPEDEALLELAEEAWG